MPRTPKVPDQPHFMVARELLSTLEYDLDRGEYEHGPEPHITSTIEHIRYAKDQDKRPMDRFTVIVGTGKDAYRVLVTATLLPDRGDPNPDEDEPDDTPASGIHLTLGHAGTLIDIANALAADPGVGGVIRKKDRHEHDH